MLSSLLLAAALTFTEKDAQLAYNYASNFVASHTPRDAGTVRGRLAANWILDAVSMQGADIRRDRFEAMTPDGLREFTNLTCAFTAQPDAEWIVLLSHYDTKPGVACPGANDGASTTGLLMAYAALLSERGLPRGNLALVWTDGEECRQAYGPNDGLWGARRAVEDFARRGRKIRAAICLDMLGDRDLAVTIPSNADPTLSKIAVHAARRAGLGKDFVRQIPEIVTDDHVPFMEAGHKAIVLIDFDYGATRGANDYWHTPQDTMDKVSVSSLLSAGTLVAEILNIVL
jgi:hypothetical protein